MRLTILRAATLLAILQTATLLLPIERGSALRLGPAVLRTTFAEMEHRTDIKRLHVHGEKAAAYMADGMRALRASPVSAWRR